MAWRDWEYRGEFVLYAVLLFLLFPALPYPFFIVAIYWKFFPENPWWFTIRGAIFLVSLWVGWKILERVTAKFFPGEAEVLAFSPPRAGGVFLYAIFLFILLKLFAHYWLGDTPLRGGFLAELGYPALLVEAIKVVLVAPIWEEGLFRGFIFQGLTKFMREEGAILGSAFLWALVHGFAGWLPFSYLFIFGILLGAIRHSCKSLVPCWFLHTLNNGYGWWRVG